MKEKIAVVANNPLSKNIANILNYKDGILESELRKEARAISDKIKEKFPDKSVDFATIISWTLADKEDPNKARIFIGFEKFTLFAKTVGIDYWKLFIPDNFIDPNILPPQKKETIEMIMRIDNETLMDKIQDLIIACVDEEAKRAQKLKTDISDIKGKPNNNNL